MNFLEIKCVFRVSLQIFRNIYIKRTERDIVTNVQMSSYTVPVILVRF